MTFHELSLKGVFRIEIEKRDDHRGFFARSWCAAEFEKQGLCTDFVQHNIGFSLGRGTLRGMHYQGPPHEEVKLVRCTLGRVFDVAVDLRPRSKSYLSWCGIELSASTRTMLYVPEGCAHGYLTLEDNTELMYYTSKAYAPRSATGLRFDDPTIGIVWPEEIKILSAADQEWPLIER
jgi:dTDP-4-dehydrorhamnose 3,5-epimerase